VNRGRAALSLIALWTIPGALYTLEQAYAWGPTAPGRLWRAALYQIPSWYVWAIATPIVVWLARRAPLARGAWLRALPVHVAACVGVACCYAAVKAGLQHWTLPHVEAPFVARMADQLALWLPASALTYAAVLGATMAIAHARRAQQRELRAARLEAELSRAQLEALRAQIHPHFVFNALHTVSAIVRAREPDRAVAVLVSLAELLRDAFRGAPDREVALREELAWVARYLAIQQARYGDRVEIVWRVGDGTLDALVPQLVLQPLVENAFRHGIARRAAPGRIELSAERRDETLMLRVRDDGPELDDVVAPGASPTGLASARARLALLYADAAQLTLTRDPDATVATVSLPFHVAPSAAAGAS
jgi:anti-sigma regulatory factor (Ser/Thr protein kinase)